MLPSFKVSMAGGLGVRRTGSGPTPVASLRFQHPNFLPYASQTTVPSSAGLFAG